MLDLSNAINLAPREHINKAFFSLFGQCPISLIALENILFRLHQEKSPSLDLLFFSSIVDIENAKTFRSAMG